MKGSFKSFRAKWHHAPLVFTMATAVACGESGNLAAQSVTGPTSAEILHELRSFRVYASVLHVGAHPDDENTQLIAYLAHGRAYRTGYLSITRGDGGQNLLGTQLGEKLGVARTQELLVARRIDGGEQFFTRAIDYGFSKDVNEALRVWGKDEVLGDVVRVIRKFRPDVIITRFSPQPGGTHGHHTASAALALEAFRLAGDSTAYPEQLRELRPWQPRRIFMNVGGIGGRVGAPMSGATVSIDVSGVDPVTGETFAAVAARSRAMHKTQGFDLPGGPLGRGGAGGAFGASRTEAVQLLAGEAPASDIMDGVDTTWSRVPGGADIGRMANDAIAAFNPRDPSASVPALLAIRARLSSMPRDAVLDAKREQLDHILQWCLGLTVETLTPRADVVLTEPFEVRHKVTLHSSVPVWWKQIRFPFAQRDYVLRDVTFAPPRRLAAGETAETAMVQRPINNRPLSQPYWLRDEGRTGLYRVADASLIGTPEDPPVFPVEYEFEVAGQTLTIRDQPVHITSTPGGERREKLHNVAPVALAFASDAGVFSPGGTRPVTVSVATARDSTRGSIALELPAGWRATPATQSFNLASAGQKAMFTFNVTAPPRTETASIRAFAEVNGARYDNQRIEVKYAHIPTQILQPPARLRAASFELVTRGRRIGYVPGAGDLIPASLVQMGYEVDTIGATEFTAEGLRGLDAIVVGIRAYNVNTAFPGANDALFRYAEQGGTVVVQYNTTSQLRTITVAPFPLTISDGRVTDENAAVTFLAPDHPVLNFPNRITSADFEGWVQERGLYFPSQWDNRFVPIIASGDAGEDPLRGGLLVAQHGRGHFVYTGLAFFRQLPAGVPGAYRLFANMLALGI